VVRRKAANHGHAIQAEGCPERFSIEFMLWVARYRRRSRPKALRAIAELAPDVPFHRLRNPQEVERFLAAVADHHP
jgi:hypothetical protein